MKMVLGMQQSCACKGIPIKRKDEGLEVKSGNLFIVQHQNNKLMRIPVYVRVYQNSFEHYAVVYRDNKFTNKAVFVNLKNSIVQKNETKDNEFVVIPDNVEGTSHTFQTPNPMELDEWAEALRSNVTTGSPSSGYSISPSMSPVIPRTPLMPTLQETEEEES